MPAFPFISIILLALLFGGYALFASRHAAHDLPKPQKRAASTSLITLVSGALK
jgi:hypothetical protein